MADTSIESPEVSTKTTRKNEDLARKQKDFIQKQIHMYK